MATSLLAAVLVTAAFAVLAYRLGTVSRGGAIGGFVVGAAIYACLGPQGFAVLVLFVAGGSALTRLGYGSKRRAGAAQEYGGRRGARNALANAGVAVLCALLYALGLGEAYSAAYVAAIGAAFADTAESEVGGLSPRPPRLVTTFQKAPPGTDGAVSLVGTLAGIAAAGLTAALGWGIGMIWSPGMALVVATAAFLGTVVDSVVGARLSRVGNEATNVLCTLTAATIVLLSDLL